MAVSTFSKHQKVVEYCIAWYYVLAVVVQDGHSARALSAGQMAFRLRLVVFWEAMQARRMVGRAAGLVDGWVGVVDLAGGRGRESWLLLLLMFFDWVEEEVDRRVWPEKATKAVPSPIRA